MSPPGFLNLIKIVAFTLRWKENRKLSSNYWLKPRILVVIYLACRPDASVQSYENSNIETWPLPLWQPRSFSILSASQYDAHSEYQEGRWNLPNYLVMKLLIVRVHSTKLRWYWHVSWLKQISVNLAKRHNLLHLKRIPGSLNNCIVSEKLNNGEMAFKTWNDNRWNIKVEV